MLKLSTPAALEWSMMVFSAGINTSHPSRPNLFSLVHLLARNSSNLKTHEHVKLLLFILILLVFTLTSLIGPVLLATSSCLSLTSQWYEGFQSSLLSSYLQWYTLGHYTLYLFLLNISLFLNTHLSPSLSPSLPFLPLSLSLLHFALSLMCIYSRPIWVQYTLFSLSSISLSIRWSFSPPMTVVAGSWKVLLISVALKPEKSS